MGYTVVEEFIRNLFEARFFIKAARIGLRFKAYPCRAEFFLRDAYSFGEDPAAKPHAPVARDNAADSCRIVEYCACVHNAKVCGDAAFIAKIHMVCLPVAPVKLRIRAFLLHDEHRDAKAQNIIKLIGTQLVKTPDTKLHAKGGLATNCVTIIPDSAGKWHWQPEGDELRSYNPEQAKAVLEAAGFTDTDGDGIREDAEGNKLSFRFTCMEKHRETGLILQSNWKDIGVETTIEFVDSARQTEIVYSENFNTDILIWGWGVKYDPSYMLYNLTTDAIGGASDCNYSNADYDALYEQQNSELDEEARLQMVYDMQKIVYEDAPYIPLYMEYYVEVYRADRWQGWQEWPAGNTIMSVYMLKYVTPVEN